jgi:Domain of unknown function (DUF4136)
MTWFQLTSILIFSMLVVLILPTCRKPIGIQQLTSGFTVITHTDIAVQFSNYSTYYISDTVVNLSGTASDTIITGSAASPFVQAVKQNMNARGFSFASHPPAPDLAIAVCVLRDIRSSVAFYPGWWDNISGYWDPLYWLSNNSFPYYYGWSTTYTYQNASVIVNLIDLKNAHVDKRLAVIWHVTGFNAFSSDSATNLQSSINAINQAFAQSPYLKK